MPAPSSSSTSNARSARARWRGVQSTKALPAPSWATSGFNVLHTSARNTTRPACAVYTKAFMGGSCASVDLGAGLSDQVGPFFDFDLGELTNVLGGLATGFNALCLELRDHVRIGQGHCRRFLQFLHDRGGGAVRCVHHEPRNQIEVAIGFTSDAGNFGRSDAGPAAGDADRAKLARLHRSEEHTSELQSRENLV